MSKISCSNKKPHIYHVGDCKTENKKISFGFKGDTVYKEDIKGDYIQHAKILRIEGNVIICELTLNNRHLKGKEVKLVLHKSSDIELIKNQLQINNK